MVGPSVFPVEENRPKSIKIEKIQLKSLTSIPFGGPIGYCVAGDAFLTRLELPCVASLGLCPGIYHTPMAATFSRREC